MTVTGCLCPVWPAAPHVLAQTPGPTNPSLAGGELTAGQAGGPTPGGRGGTQRLEPPAATRGLDLVSCALGTWEHPTGRCAGDQAPPGLKSRPQLPPRFPAGRPPITTLLLRPNSSWSLDTAKWGMWGWGSPAHARTILAASRGPQTSDPPPPAPALPAPWAEWSLLRRDKSARSPGTPRELPAPRRRDPAPQGPARALGARPRFPPGKLQRDPARSAVTH